MCGLRSSTSPSTTLIFGVSYQVSQGGGIGRRARLRIWCRKACRFESCPWQLFFREGSIPFVDVIERAIVRNVEVLLPTAITEVADGFKGSSRHFGGRLFRKVSSSFDQAYAICFIRERQIQYRHYLWGNVDIRRRQFVFKTNLEIWTRSNECVVNIEPT